MVPRALRLSLLGAQLATVATLMRSVALDRWITVVACLVLLGATTAAVRGRTWGVALAYTVGITFFSLSLLGIAPPWFLLLGFIAVRPFARVFRHLLGFDRGAATTLLAGATAIGGAAGLAWRAFAHDLFNAIPALIPSWHPHHGPVVAALGAVGTYFVLRQHAHAKALDTSAAAPASALGETEPRIRVATDVTDEVSLDEDELEAANPKRLRLTAK